MVPLSSKNIYDLRNHLLERAHTLSKTDPFKYSWMTYLGYDSAGNIELPEQLYKKCALFGFQKEISLKEKDLLTRLLGQAHSIDGTPSPWVSDMWVVLSIKWAVDKAGDSSLNDKFNEWAEGFLPQRIKAGRLDLHEKTIADYLNGNTFTPNSSSSIALFLHFRGIQTIEDAPLKKGYVAGFLKDFNNAYQASYPAPLLGVFVYVFDHLNAESALAPPNNWTLDDLIHFLESIPIGLRRWTWEDKPRTSGGNIVKWPVENEYHVQNLLYLMLGPIFPDITDETYTEPVGQKNPRIDLHLPSAETIIEVKYRKDNKKSFQAFIGEIAEDASLYHADPKFKHAKLIVFLWDHTRSTQEHSKFKEGVIKIEGVDGCVIISSPSVMV